MGDLQVRAVVLAGTERRAAQVAARRGLVAGQVTIPTTPADLRDVSGLPVLFDESAWDSEHADAFADYFANQAHLGRSAAKLRDHERTTMDAMESIKTEAREAIHQELRDFRGAAADRLAGYDDTVLVVGGTWDAAVERIVARIESAADDMDPAPFPIGSGVYHHRLPDGWGRGVVIDRTETDGELHTVKVRWPNLGDAIDSYSPRELTAAEA